MTTSETDGPWKEAIETYLEDFLRLFFPAVHAGVDWSRGYEFLDAELQKTAPEAETGKHLADKLVKVFRREGEEVWILIHIEVQGQRDPQFERRMYVYHYLIFNHYGHEVVSLAVLADDSLAWRPSSFGYSLWGFRLQMDFPTVKLLDMAEDWTALEESRNPFALVTMAHLKARATVGDLTERLRWKMRLVRSLYEKAYTRQDVLSLFRFLDWLMALPEELARSFKNQVRRIEEEKKMPFVTSVELLGREEGLQQGLQQGLQEGLQAALLDLLTARFGDVPESLAAVVRAIHDPERLRALHRRAVTIESLSALAREMTPSA